jgi:hypothetical protein
MIFKFPGVPMNDQLPHVAEVFFVEPNPASADGFRSLGHYPMASRPEIGETVTIASAMRATPQRYRVRHVIHHIPPLQLVGSNQEDVLVTCTCVIAQEILDTDVAILVARLCQTEIPIPDRPERGNS